MKRILSVTSTLSALATIVFFIRAGYGVFTTEEALGGDPANFNVQVKRFLIWAFAALALSIGAGQISKRL